MSYGNDIRRSVVPYDLSEKAGLRDFQREYFGVGSRQCDEAFTEWLFERNPHRRYDAPVIWICKRDGVVVGQQASVPVRVRVGEREMLASWGIDLMIRREWRLRGIAPALSAAYEQSADLLLGLGVSATAFRAYSRAGWTDMGRLPFIVRPIDVHACAEALESRKWIGKLAPDLLVRGSARFIAGIARTFSRCTLEGVHRLDERVNGVWEKSARDYPVLVKRDFTSLRWRFDRFPQPGRYERYYLMQGSRVLGYAVTRFDRWRGYPVARLVDYLAERRNLRTLFALLIDAMRAKGAAAVFVEQRQAGSTKTLRSLGCFNVNPTTRFIVKARPAAAPLADILQRADGWLITRADSDSDLSIVDTADVVSVPPVRLSGRPAPGSWSA